jgi:hypothetical protein
VELEVEQVTLVQEMLLAVVEQGDLENQKLQQTVIQQVL